MKFIFALLISASSALALDALAKVNPDRTVTFDFVAPNAKEVQITGDWGKGGALTKNEAGVWHVTLGPLAPNIYSYSFLVDGKQVADPLNSRMKPQRIGFSNALTVPDDKPALWDRQTGVPHGVVHLHEYDSKALGVTRRMRVYTPPGYAENKEERYPVLYLFHGSGDNEATWTEFGRAHDILDNLIAAGKAKAMVVVMMDGHTAPPVPRDAPGAAEARNKNTANFERDLLGDVMPLVDATYRTRTDRESHAIIGLSMGGNQSLTVGLNHLEKFAWVGGMSSAVREPETQLAAFFGNPKAAEQLKLLWIGCGKDDERVAPEARKMDAMLTEKKVKHTYVESAGNHSWPVWRRYLIEFAPLLF